VVPGAQVRRALAGREKQIVELAEATYRLHGAGDSVNPPSYFLRFPDRPTSRIIALPASIGGPHPVDGLKWISSFPQNVAAGIPRASAVLILNDHDTGYPFACLESSIISATRTAASAALAADWLSRGRPRPRRLGLVGAGLIAGSAYRYLRAAGWEFDEVGVHDVIHDRAVALGSRLAGAGGPPVVVHQRAGDLLRRSDLVVFATVAGRPHVTDPELLDHHPLVLHLSLRDLAPELILGSVNVVDDVDHCLRADTSVHLAEQVTGKREHITGTLADVMAGRTGWPDDATVIFSPFGLGVLDLALGLEVYRVARDGQGLTVVPDFFGSGA
jgi:ornithine cyclodeaminase